MSFLAAKSRVKRPSGISMNCGWLPPNNSKEIIAAEKGASVPKKSDVRIRKYSATVTEAVTAVMSGSCETIPKLPENE